MSGAYKRDALFSGVKSAGFSRTEKTPIRKDWEKIIILEFPVKISPGGIVARIIRRFFAGENLKAGKENETLNTDK